MNDTIELNWMTMKSFLADRVKTCKWLDHKDIYEKLLGYMIQLENGK